MRAERPRNSFTATSNARSNVYRKETYRSRITLPGSAWRNLMRLPDRTSFLLIPHKETYECDGAPVILLR
mgnify:CR=1 FL=1